MQEDRAFVCRLIDVYGDLLAVIAPCLYIACLLAEKDFRAPRIPNDVFQKSEHEEEAEESEIAQGDHCSGDSQRPHQLGLAAIRRDALLHIASDEQHLPNAGCQYGQQGEDCKCGVLSFP